MCIIVSKDLGVEFPSKKTLKTCFENNPDGAGYMYQFNNKVHIRKGFMDFKSFWSDLEKTRHYVGDEAPYVMHFRISTQAGVNKQCTHPFPLSPKMDDLKALYSDTNVGIAHNGIIDLTSESYYSKTRVTYSDTMKFITDYLTLIADKADWYKDNHKVALVKRLISGSRLAILDKSGHIEYIGDTWNTDDKGVKYSNTSWKALKISPSYSSYSSYGTGYGTYSGKYDDKYWNDYSTNYWEDEEDDLDKYSQWVESNYNEKTGQYMFDMDAGNCPLYMYDDDSYCYDCVNKHACYFLGALDEAKTDWDNKKVN